MDAHEFEMLTRTLAQAPTRRRLLGLLAGAFFSAWRAPIARGAQPGCAPGLADCGGLCVDLLTDPDNCGACFTPCESGLVTVACQGGQCVRDECAPGLTYCGAADLCRDLSADPAHCGGCGNACASGMCNGGVCVAPALCEPGLAECGGRCAALSNDPFHCGACFNACAGVPLPGQSSVGACVEGICRIVCEPGFAECSGRCVDLVSDPFHCGACFIVEPDGELPVAPGRGTMLVPGPEPIQPARTVKTRLCDDDGLMAQMHAKTRYNVRMAKRREVSCRVADHTDESVAVFYGLLQDTASRNAFAVHEADYYREFLRQFERDALLMFAEIEGRVVAGVIAAVFGEEAIYMYGASSTKDRANGAGFLIQYEAMRWARERGALRYDMWGIPEYDPESTVGEGGDRLASSHGGDWRGIYEFKTRFGGEIVQYPRPVERRYHPLLASLARRFYSPGGAG